MQRAWFWTYRKLWQRKHNGVSMTIYIHKKGGRYELIGVSQVTTLTLAAKDNYKMLGVGYHADDEGTLAICQRVSTGLFYHAPMRTYHAYGNFPAVLYKCCKTGQLWVRSQQEFFDGRFKKEGHVDTDKANVRGWFGSLVENIRSRLPNIRWGL